jgi:hypothetical protein
MDGNAIEELIRRIQIFFPAKVRDESVATLAALRNENMQLRSKLFEFELEARRDETLPDIPQ